MAVQFPSGNVYVVDTGNHRVQAFTNDGKFLNKWELPSGTSVVSPITGIDIDVNSAGTIFLTDANCGYYKCDFCLTDDAEVNNWRCSSHGCK